MTGRAARRGALLTAALLLAAAAACAGETVPDPPFVSSSRPEGPDVVFIVIDTLRADHLGVYGSDAGLTPELDGFAAGAHVFEKAVATSSWTRPSIASMLTSRYPTALGLLGRQDTLHPGFVTFPELLRHFRGYTTLGLIANGNVSEDFGFGDGFDTYRMPRLRRSYPGDFAIPVAEGVTREALEMVDSRDPDRPLFLFVLYVDPHDPYLPHADPPGPPPAGRFSGSRPDLRALAETLRSHQATPADLDRIRRLYAGEVRYVDRWVGELLRGLEERGLRDDAMIVITADHGEGLWDHGRRGHGDDLYEEQVHVPLLVKYPGMAPGEGGRIDTPASLVDLGPTFLEVADVPVPPSFQGSDLTPLAGGRARGPGFDHVYSELDLEGRAFESIRKGSLKLIVERRKGPAQPGPPSRELYDLAADPDEREDLLADDGAATELDAALERWRVALLADAASRNELDVELDAETRDSLEALGYLRAGGDPGPSAPAAARPGDLELPRPPTRSEIRLVEPSEGTDHLLDGPDPGSTTVAGTRLAAAFLLRGREHDRWRLDLTVPADPGVARARVLDVSVNLADPVRTTLTETGHYRIDGRLPPGGLGDAVRLDIRCFVEAGDAGRLETAEDGCVTLRGISLR